MGFFQRLLFSLLGNSILFWLVEKKISVYVPGTFETSGGWKTYLSLAIIFCVLNTIVRPILYLVSLPLRWFTLGLFSLVINAALLWLLEEIVKFLDFADIALTVSGWESYVVIGLILSIFHGMLHWFEKSKN